MRAALYGFLDCAMTVNDRKEQVAFNPTKNKVANVLEATGAEAQLPRRILPPAWLAGAPQNAPLPEDLIVCRNGMLHLPSRRMLPHSPLFFNLNSLPFDYDPKASTPQQWLNFLASIWPGDQASIDTLQEIFGLSLTADTRHHKAFLLIGPPRCGKGTILRVLGDLLGADNVCSPTLASLSTNFGLAPLIGKRVAMISDARLSSKVDQAIITERLLSITGEDSLTIDRKYLTQWHGRLSARFVILSNELPKLSDASGALASRFVLMKLVVSFLGREDLALGAKLKPEMPGILNWSIAGLERLRERGYFVPPPSAAAALAELLDLGSPVKAFLRECCTVAPGASVQIEALYYAWTGWCREHGRDHPGTTHSFGRDLGSAIPGLKQAQHTMPDGKRPRFYEGVGFNQDHAARDYTRAEALCSQRCPDSHPDAFGPDDPYQ